MSADIVPMVMCESNKYWSKKVVGKSGTYTVTFDSCSHRNQGKYVCDYSCDCAAYKFAKPTKYCKHIEAVKAERCGWSEQMDGGEAKRGKCPQCGGKIVGVIVAV